MEQDFKTSLRFNQVQWNYRLQKAIKKKQQIERNEDKKNLNLSDVSLKFHRQSDKTKKIHII